jgi:hypothetical protein
MGPDHVEVCPTLACQVKVKIRNILEIHIYIIEFVQV